MEPIFNDGGRVTAPEGGPLLTKQSMAAATDVNAIVARHIAHGLPLPNGSDRQFNYGDFSSFEDLHTSMNRVKAAEVDFMALPSAVRDHCNNDPREFLRLVFDPARRGELEKLGLVERLAPEAAPPAEKPVIPAVAPVVEPLAAPGHNVGT